MSLFKAIRERLKNAGIVSPDAEARLIISDVTGKPLGETMLLSQNSIDREQKKLLDAIVNRRCNKEPLQYIIGKTFFRNLELTVGKEVLIPRPETELLVDFVINNVSDSALVCDVGTGCGAIALAIAFERKNSFVYGLDISDRALIYANKNKEKLGISNVEFLVSDLFEVFKSGKFKFDVITANLPYVPNSEYAWLPMEIRNFEPENALNGGEDGLVIVKRFLKEAIEFLSENGLIVAEIGEKQSQLLFDFLCVTDISKKVKAWTRKDLNGKERFFICRKVV